MSIYVSCKTDKWEVSSIEHENIIYDFTKLGVHFYTFTCCLKFKKRSKRKFYMQKKYF